MGLITTFQGIAMATLGNGSTILLWEDVWNYNLYALKFPALYSFLPMNNCPDIQCLGRRLGRRLKFPARLGRRLEFYEYNSMLEDIQCFLPMNNCPDAWFYIWGTDLYSSQKNYKFCFHAIIPSRALVWIWKSKLL